MADLHGNGDGLLRPFIPIPDVHVRAANGGFGDFYEQVVVTDFGHGQIGEGEAFVSGQFCEGFHRMSLFSL